MIQSKAQAISRELFRRKVARGVIIHTPEARRRCKARLRYDSRGFFSFLKRRRIATLRAQRDAVRNQQREAIKAQREADRAQRQAAAEKRKQAHRALVAKRKKKRQALIAKRKKKHQAMVARRKQQRKMRAARRKQRRQALVARRKLDRRAKAFVAKRHAWRVRLRSARKVVLAAEQMRLLALKAEREARRDRRIAERVERAAKRRVTLLTQSAPVFMEGFENLPAGVRAAIDNAFFEAEVDYVPDEPFVTQHQELREDQLAERQLREDHQPADPELEHA